MSDEVADALAAGREYIEKNGWWRGGFLGPNGHQACAIGGLLFSHGLGTDTRINNHPLLSRAIQRLAMTIDPDQHHGASQDSANGTVWMWNDSRYSCENKQAVLDMFARAEKIERAGYDPDA